MLTTRYKTERIRDPLHNLIEFRIGEEFERVMWKVVQTKPFQRLRRIKQLGFSDLVYPGASHSRFLHSLGVFHTARRLMLIVQKEMGDQFSPSKAQQALAAALVHDLGHGPFSHAFEAVGKRLGLKLAKHEAVSDLIIRNGEVADILKELGGGFAGDVADIVAEEGEKNVYRAVVSSQFDADRLDYMQRDRLMTGAQSGAIDFEWLLANLQIGEVPEGVDEEQTGTVQTFVLGPKANMAAEAFVLGLFQLYPSIYFHKTTRACECKFVELLCRTITLVQTGLQSKTGLPKNHPIVQFAENTDSLEIAQRLDDAVMWGALTMMAQADDALISEFSTRLLVRDIYKCLDLRNIVSGTLSQKGGHDVEPSVVEAILKKVCVALEDWTSKNSTNRAPRVLLDEGKRSPYKAKGESKGPADRINILTPSGTLSDLGDRSEVVAALEPFKFSRAYVASDDKEAKEKVMAILAAEVAA